MNRTAIISIILIIFSSTSCASNTGTGVIAGSVVGTGLGSLGGGTGALIGATAGIITGGLIGASLDQKDRNTLEQVSPRTVHRMDKEEPLTINDVIKLSKNGVSDETIIQYLKDTKSSYHLSQTQIRRLQDAGVSPAVIQYMMQT